MIDLQSNTIGIFIHSCHQLPDYRKSKGRRYSLDLLLFCLLITEFSATHHQRGRHRYLKNCWDWIGEIWFMLTGSIVPESTPSQSTLCRLMAKADSFALMKRFLRNKQAGRNLEYKPLPGKSLPHYAIDGKSRKGILSEETGRTEMDVTIIDVEYRTIEAKMALSDKKGESRIASFLVSDTAKKLQPGIMTFDAGLTCPKLIGRVVKGNHHYIAALKGNAGNCFEEAKQLNWDHCSFVSTEDNAHGRREIREVRKVSSRKISDSFSKYPEFGAILAVDSYRTENSKTSYERRFYIASNGVKNLPLNEQLTYIREHWVIENGLHWPKDAILKEDSAQEKTKKSSRLLGFLKDIVVSIGFGIFKSVKEFVDNFRSNPRLTFDKILE